MPRRFLQGKAPYFRMVDEKKITTTRMMNDVIIALIPIILFAWVKNGLIPYINNQVTFYWMLKPLIFVICGALFSILLEGLYFYLFKKIRSLKYLIIELKISYPIIPGIILALILPLYTPIWVLALGCFFANILFKMLYGGFGYNLFNPALIAYVIIMFSLAGYIGAQVPSGAYFNQYEAFSLVTGSTPLTNLANNGIGSYHSLVVPYGNLWDFFLGLIPGSIGETSALLCILAFIYLAIRRVINWLVPVIYVGTIFIITLIIGFTNHQGIWFPLFNIFSGGVMFAAVFMITEPVTTPRSPNGQLLFAFGLGVLTVLFRLIGTYPEGVGTAILFLSLFSPILDRFASKLRASKPDYKRLLKMSGVILFFVLIAIFTIVRLLPNDNIVDIIKGGLL